MLSPRYRPEYHIINIKLLLHFWQENDISDKCIAEANNHPDSLDGLTDDHTYDTLISQCLFQLADQIRSSLHIK